MKTFSSFIPMHDCVVFTKSQLLEDSSFKYSDIGWLSANLCFKFMNVMGIEEEGESSPYSHLCRFLKGSIPTWRLTDCPQFRTDTEAFRHAVKLRKFLRMIRNFEPTLKSDDITIGTQLYMLVNSKTGRSLAYIHKY